jgi:hypothetical protein
MTKTSGDGVKGADASARHVTKMANPALLGSLGISWISLISWM